MDTQMVKMTANVPNYLNAFLQFTVHDILFHITAFK